ncbi:MAG: beta-galactosidase [Phycisphaeraceae bacterium]|nr:MAG: beta-galactosidase [Phycisphaeraceae bacterium]
MTTIEVRDRVLWVGGRRVPLLSGEMHYWRLSPDRWRDVLKAWPRLGLTMVSTYVPWEYHETAPGVFDFEGTTEPARNLVGFLTLAKEMGLDVAIRPGPYIYAEWTDAGVPTRVALMHRMSSAYRAEAAVWMKGVVGAVRPFFATDRTRYPDGGPIVLFQPDNEVDLFSHWFERECGLCGPETADGPAVGGPGRGEPGGGGASPFGAFLRSVYPDVASLNAAWGTRYTSFDQARAYASAPDRSAPEQRRRARDYWRFQHWATASIVRWHANTYRSMGVDLPMVANYYPGGDVQNWKVLARDGGVDFLAIDWYPRAHFRGPPAPESREGQASGGGGIFGLPEHRERRVFMDSCRLQSVYSPIPFIGEFECGVWHGYHEYTGILGPGHYREIYDAATKAGIAGLNWYMFAGRDNWYFTPVNERGVLRPDLAGEFLEIHRRFRDEDQPSRRRGCRVAAVFEPEQIGTDNALADNPVLQALHDAGLDYHMWDPDLGQGRAGGHEPEPTVLVYAGADWLARASQLALRAAVEGGKTLVLPPRRPVRDERFEPFDAFGVPAPDAVLSHLGKKVEVTPGTGGEAGVAEGPVMVWSRASLPAGATAIEGVQCAGRQQAIENSDRWMTNAIGTRWCVGYRARLGKGELIVLGVAMSPSIARMVGGGHAAAG